MNSKSLKDVLTNGVTITSSGTTGTPKKIFRSANNIKESIKVALEAQQIHKKSKILTVTKTNHAGGLLTQTIPAFSIGAEYTITEFNAFNFFKKFNDYTHTFLTPNHMRALMYTKDFTKTDLSQKWILGGSDIVTWDMIEAFVKQGAIVQPNWGMSEIGPITINTIFDNLEKVYAYKELLNEQYIMGDRIYCDTKIVDGILFVKGPTCVENDWFNTRDKVEFLNNTFIYKGRS